LHELGAIALIQMFRRASTVSAASSGVRTSSSIENRRCRSLSGNERTALANASWIQSETRVSRPQTAVGAGSFPAVDGRRRMHEQGRRRGQLVELLEQIGEEGRLRTRSELGRSGHDRFSVLGQLEAPAKGRRQP
jgi:hypothetical protein